MKKPHFKLAALTTITVLLTLTAQSQTTQILAKPEKSRGYIAWNETNDADHYKLHLLERLENGTINEMSAISTTELHTQIDPSILLTHDIAYYVTSHNSSGIVIDFSDTIWTDMPGNLGYELVCSKTCVGNTYAWTLNTYAKVVSQTLNQQGVLENVLGNMHLKLTPAAVYWDQPGGNYTPFWQAVSQIEWLTLRNNFHPYTRINNANLVEPQGTDFPWSYGYYLSESFNTTNGGGPFYNGNGFQLTSGKLIEKKLDEFHGFEGTMTDLNIFFSDCSMGTQGWINFFNTYNLADMNSFPSNLTWFNNGNTPLEIDCMGDVFNTDTLGGNTWDDWYHGVYKEIAELDTLFPISDGSGGFTWNEYLNLHSPLAMLSSSDGVTITGVSVTSLTDTTFSVEMLNDNGRFKLMHNSGDLTPSLYKVILFTSDGNAILSYYDIDNSIPEAKIADMTTVNIAPNPMEGEHLYLEINSSANFTGQLRVHDFNGNLLHSQPVAVTANDPENLNVEIISNSLQLFVSLILPDGGVIQKQVINPQQTNPLEN